MSRYLVVDLEAVPDVDVGARLWGLTGSPVEIARGMLAHRKAETDGKTDFLKAGMFQVVAIGLVGIDADRMTVKAQTAAGHEASLIRLFNVWLDRKARPILAGWNVRGFDLPVLFSRAMLHGISLESYHGAAGEKAWEKYGGRYGDWLLDLGDHLSNFGGCPMLKLDEAAALCGLPTKPMHGGDVMEAWFADKWADVESYVGDDAIGTARLLLRYEASRGRIPPATMDALDRKLTSPQLLSSWKPAAPEPELALSEAR